MNLLKENLPGFLHETLDRAWAYLEADVMLPLSNSSASCWTFFCHKTKDWVCQPHVLVAEAPKQ